MPRTHTHEPLWGDDWGDRSYRTLEQARRDRLDFEALDSTEKAEKAARQARYVAALERDAKRRRSAPAEAKARREERQKSRRERGTFGALLAQELAKANRRDKKS